MYKLWSRTKQTNFSLEDFLTYQFKFTESHESSLLAFLSQQKRAGYLWQPQ